MLVGCLYLKEWGVDRDVAGEGSIKLDAVVLLAMFRRPS